MSRAGRKQSNYSDSDDDSQLCKALFLDYVKNNPNGKIIGLAAFGSLIQQTGRNPSESAISSYWATYNKDKRGVKLDDFLQICKLESVTTKQEILEAFEALDVNGDGYLTADEFVDLLSSGSEMLSKSEVREIIAMYDRNKDGKLDFEEFADFILKDVKKCRKALEEKSKNIKAPLKQDEESSEEEDESPRPRPVPRKRTENSDPNVIGSNTAVTQKEIREPPRLQSWEKICLKGFFIAEKTAETHVTIMSTYYKLQLKKKGFFYITMQESDDKLGSGSVPNVTDLRFAIAKDKTIVAITEGSVFAGKSKSHQVAIKAELEAGIYFIIPFSVAEELKPEETSGSRHDKPLLKKEGSKYDLSPAFKSALQDIFNMCDLNGDGYITKEEFAIFNLVSSCEDLSDELWNALSDMVSVKNGKLNLSSFHELHYKEAETDQWSEDNLRVTLSSFGFNGQLKMVSSFPFKMTFYSNDYHDFNITTESPTAYPVDVIAKGVGEYVKAKGNSTVLGDCKLYWLETPLAVYIAGEKEKAIPTQFAMETTNSRGLQCPETVHLYVRKTCALLSQLVPSDANYTFHGVLS